MTELEQLAGLVMQIRNLRARIESAGEDCLTWEEEWELEALEKRLERMKGGVASYGRRKAVCHPC
jgi:hypothetical protein